MSKSVLVSHNGAPCPRCGNATTVYRHAEITKKQRRQPWFHEFWYRCTNNDCRTTLIMPEESRVYRTPRLKKLIRSRRKPVKSHSEPWMSDEEAKVQVGPPPWESENTAGIEGGCLPCEDVPYPNLAGD